jgi:hypothetical protein
VQLAHGRRQMVSEEPMEPWDIPVTRPLPSSRISYVYIYIVTCFTEGNNRIRDTAGNNCKLLYNRIRDTVAPFLVTVTIGLYGYEANNSMRGYVETGELALEVSLRQSSELVREWVYVS